MTSEIVLSQTDPRPMYRQIQDRIKQLVAAGDWSPGLEIPSIRQLAVGLRVSVITVKRAYLELEREGVIVTRQGKGSSIAEQPDLPNRVRSEELRRHLEEAARLAATLGWNDRQLRAELEDAHHSVASKPELDGKEEP
jgi:GntR family transcriptional regulator